jgi:hypothetical protein
MDGASGKEAGAQKSQSNEKTDERKTLDERKSEATSSETLTDLQETESESGSTNSKRDPGPSPDGLLDEPDEIKDAGPM